MTGVIHVVTSLERGGAQRNTLETAARLHDPGRPQLLVSGAPGALDTEAARRLGARFMRVPDLVGPVHPPHDMAAAFGLLRLLDRQVERLGAPVVVHTHSSKAGILGRLVARAVPGVIVVHTVHGFGLDALGPRRRWALEAAERVAGPAADVMVFVSEADRLAAEAMKLARPPVRSLTIRSGVDPTPFKALRGDTARRATARLRMGVPHDAPLAVTVGNLKPQKDPLFHLEILAAWRRSAPDARLLFVGDGPLRTAAESRAKALGVADALLLPGFIENTTHALAAADVFLLASAWEGLPRAVLEALAAGLPCVVRDTGWASDLSWAKHCTTLPPDAAAQAFASALVRAIERTGRAPGQGARRSPRRRHSPLPRAFTLDGMLLDLSDLYDELVGPPAPMLRRRARRRPRLP